MEIGSSLGDLPPVQQQHRGLLLFHLIVCSLLAVAKVLRGDAPVVAWASSAKYCLPLLIIAEWFLLQRWVETSLSAKKNETLLNYSSLSFLIACWRSPSGEATSAGRIGSEKRRQRERRPGAR